MKLVLGICKKAASADERGSALITATLFITIASLMLGSVLVWATNHGRLEARKNELNRTQYVAEAGAEKIFCAIRDYVNSTGQSPSVSNLNIFATNHVPTSTDNAAFSSYQFLTTNGETGKIVVYMPSVSSVSAISSGTYAGLNALIAPYRVVSRANSSGRTVVLTTGVQRDVQIQHIPIFQFAIFYNMDMEIEPGPAMTVNGKVHSNGKGYFAPDTSLTFNDTVTLSLDGFVDQLMPGDTHKSGPYGPTNFSSPFTQEAPPLNLPIGSSDPHDLIELPPSSGSDPISSERMYNKAGLRIKVENGSITVTDSAGASVSAPSGGWIGSGCISTNKTIYNFREEKTITLTEVDVSQLSSKGKLPANGIVYVGDTRSGGSIQQAAVRLVNGATLPNAGLTVATLNPIYIKGDYNSAVGAPAAIFADAINVLSSSWNDSNSNGALSSRKATATAINAAFFSGIVPTTTGQYSGGVENFPRFLEDWSGGVTLTYTGSMVIMFDSEIALGKWSKSSYSPPVRNWSFDTQFLDSTKLPPGTPSVRTIRRTSWAAVN